MSRSKWCLAWVALMALGCRQDEDKADEPDEVGETDLGETDSAADGFCGDGVVDPGEECDLGDANGPDGNCFEDCTANATQSVSLSVSDVRAAFGLDAVGVEDGDAPAGVGAWGTAAERVSGSGEPRFTLDLPMFDFSDVLTPDQQALLESSPWVPPAGWFQDLRVADVAEVSFWTKTPEAEGRTPFYLVLYTQPNGVGDHASWYGHRLTGRPGPSVVEEGDAWTKWSISDVANQIVFVDQPITGTFSGSGLPTLGELVATPAFDWSSVNAAWPETSVNYGDEVLLYVSVHTASGAATTETDGLVDLIEIRFTDGRQVILDLEP